ncbi:MAG: nucleotidyltransferase family protein [Erythrobacter sp.]|uniref:nucleotidyltransferase domain-containing protein n=1 Tax=Erythrobacter sp. TaxID=1042 RepID=UPI0025DC7CD8|nr:nucleotidyltransferase family protein [Erythrobacter sp.]MCL9999647.1 nucleotidyltransferase family protein [Erythrobacter sp.]
MAEARPPIKSKRTTQGMQAFELVCACLAPAAQALPDAAAVDPGLLARVARRHQVSALVAARLEEAGQVVPDTLARQAAAARRRALQQMGAALDLAEALERGGIPVLLLKGVTLSQQAFGSPLLRGAVDIDLLVRPQDVAAAWEVLARAGWRQVNPPTPLTGARLALFCRAAKDSLHRHPETGQVLELHWRLSDELAEPLMPPVTALASLALAPGRSVRVLDDAALFLYLATHGAAHGWARIKWLADVAALLHRSPDGGGRLWAHAARGGGRIAAGSAVILAQELFGLAPPPGFVRPRGLRIAGVLWIARRIIQAGEGARELETTPWRGWAEMLAKLLVAAGWRGRLAVLRRLVLAGEDIAQVALPKGLIWLYPVLRVPLLLRRRAARGRRLREARRAGNTAP